jgi:hypothetical protein
MNIFLKAFKIKSVLAIYALNEKRVVYRNAGEEAGRYSAECRRRIM